MASFACEIAKFAGTHVPRSNRKVSPLVRQLLWTHHLIILSQAKPVEPREFYILTALKERWSKRELERQIRSGAVLREARATKKVSPAVRQTHIQCLVAFELKVDKFKPADLGQLSFYVEALDRDVEKLHERPSIGLLLCATKDDEYALARTTAPTLVAEYQTFLPSKELLRAKLHKLYAQLAQESYHSETSRAVSVRRPPSPSRKDLIHARHTLPPCKK
nr:PDDEXK nuclease domain-containing protein [Corallococcus sp. NCSPR001]